MSSASAPASSRNPSAPASNAPTLSPTSNGSDNSPSPVPPTSNAPTVRTSRPPLSPSPEPQPSPSPQPPPSPSPPPPPPPPSPSPDPPPSPPPPPSPSPNPRPTAASPPPPPPQPDPAPSPAPPPPPLPQNPSPNPPSNPPSNPSPNPPNAPPEIPAPAQPQPQPQSPSVPPAADPATNNNNNNPPSREIASDPAAPIVQQVQQQQQGEVSPSFAASIPAIDGAAATTTARDSMPTDVSPPTARVSQTVTFSSSAGVSRSGARTSTGAGRVTGTITAFNASSTVEFGGAISGSNSNGTGVGIGVVFAIVAGCVAAAALLVTLAVWWIRRDNNKLGGGHEEGSGSARKDLGGVFWSKWNKREKSEVQQAFLVADGAADENASSPETPPPPPLMPLASLDEVEHGVVADSVPGQVEAVEDEDAGLMEVAPLSATESFSSTNPLASNDTSVPLTGQQPQTHVLSSGAAAEDVKQPLLENVSEPTAPLTSTSTKIATLSVAADAPPKSRKEFLGFIKRLTARKQSAPEPASAKLQTQPATTATTTAATTTTATTTTSAAISRAYQMHRPQPTVHQTPPVTITPDAAVTTNSVPPSAYEQFQQDLALQYMYGLTNEQQQQLHQQQQHQYFSQYQMHQTAPELSGMSQEYINSWWQAFYQQNPVLAQEYYEAALKAQREGRL
ncbi:hypothetical protein HDU81_007938 [Chytriomyces hyalinus]|nr:hypothetical protein HDU81_007938 [Chytriomyces hyalinus]